MGDITILFVLMAIFATSDPNQMEADEARILSDLECDEGSA
ncbi:MAG: hypothetical protein OSB15_11320 [Amylibacter sp.]|nr:hypothetical protein [Amylibacter sp.]